MPRKDPTNEGDYLVVAISAMCIMSIAACSVYVYRNRNYPPLKVKHVPLFLTSAFGGCVWIFSQMITGEHFWRQEGTFLAECSFFSFWLGMVFGISTWIICLTVRLYRMHQIFIQKRKSSIDWNIQFVILQCPFLLLAIVGTAVNGSVHDGDTGLCVYTGPFLWLTTVAKGLVFFAFQVLAYLVRNTREEVNEYQNIRKGGILAFGFMIIIACFWGTEVHNHWYGRCMITIMVVTSVMYYFWSSVGLAVYRCYSNDEEFLQAFVKSKGVDSTRVLEGSLSFRLQDENSRAHFKEYAQKRLAEEGVEFYEAMQVRRQLTDPDELRAHSEYIIENFFKEGSPAELNVIDSTRRGILNAPPERLTDPNLFAVAEKEMFQLMNDNVFSMYLQTNTYQEWKATQKKKIEENALLAEEGLLS
eukprot:GFYU01002001.1.p1 GENE.GFYU01002001.1~~GFYU01002001.1.p1  ORF type:complete len:416 (+),score=85.50 GFYU01002001.1:213-1460(+)